MQCPVYFAKKLATFYDRKTCRGLDLSLFDNGTFRFHVESLKDLNRKWIDSHSQTLAIKAVVVFA